MINRRDFLRSLAAGGLLLAGCRPGGSDTLENPASAPESAPSVLLHRFGLPENETRIFRRLYAAGPPAEVLLYALAPERLVGWAAQKRPQMLAMLGSNAHRLPSLGGINGLSSPVSLERLLAEKIDVVVDVGVVNETTVSTAEQTTKLLGVPYLLLEGRLAQSVEQIRQLGGLLASPYTEHLAKLAEQALAFAKREADARSNPVSVYLARGLDGLKTGRRDSHSHRSSRALGCAQCERRARRRRSGAGFHRTNHPLAARLDFDTGCRFCCPGSPQPVMEKHKGRARRPRQASAAPALRLDRQPSRY